MDIYFDGKKIDGVVEVAVDYDKLEQIYNPFAMADKEISLTLRNAEMNLHTMSGKMRSWCKVLRWNGCIYW